ncbi:helix-turn-helix domain-containing protein [Variovorax paradoxus]|nr:helix-turn-helix domain-containing protein [Variovorax paradoxus]MBT2305220.1 helix-turn-helix domain-containing protein [Variovorax paradoxus]
MGNEADKRAPEKSGVGGALRTMAVLEFVASTDRPVSGAEVRRATQINPSTAFNLLQTLTTSGYLQQVGGSRLYTVGPSLKALGRKVAERAEPYHLALSQMQTFADRHKVVVHLWRRVSRYSMMCLAVADNEEAPRIQGRPNAKLPAMMGSMGRLIALAGDLSGAERQQLLAAATFERPISYRTFMAQARLAAARGWSFDDGYVRTVISAVSVPVPCLSGPLTHVCTATMFRGQLKGKELEQLAFDLQRTAALIAPGLQTM